MKASALLTTLLLLMVNNRFIFAQEANFIRLGVVTFEKRVNTHALIRKEIYKGGVDALTMEQYTSYQKNFPQFNVMMSTLSFAKDRTLFKPADADQHLNVMSNHPAMQQTNIVFTDLTGKKCTSQKSILNEVFLLKDSVKKISWKITGETREIAGYTCRRANAIIMDSIYVVAFYTDLILTEGGPESFNGLPGMILGVVLPRQNISWFAKKVVFEQMDKALSPPSKGKILNYKELIAILESPGVDKRVRMVKSLLLL